ncbi:hypothetical protein PMG71_05625 [Roseofilum sp. BLCC_M154]|uniref:CRISPR type III-B/RAMP module-associated protein Cmr5 n=1 Tax=Roseofilum acuticapitatum BLCC-M154 TaxID=3022444 RepID=A0ABT7APS3_9CYAN|nr:hypothetical protein [Roseofilum acuticapitatum]MDJ1168899.1 hypothetical protein [Roseofilum acuticapitatum BLCC-M154]
MGWTYYGLDQAAQKLVLDAKKRDRDSLNQAFKMREAVAYGLERFWGEHLRLQGKETAKSQYWKATWDKLVELMTNAGVTIPNDSVKANQTDKVQEMAQKLWEVNLQDQRVAIAVLTQLCDCLVWWTQRYKGEKETANKN